MNCKDISIVLLGMLLGSCVAVGTTEERTCNAERYIDIIGKPIDEIHVADLPKPLRIYSTGDLITMDYQPERLNVVVGADRHVLNVKCG